MSNTFKHLYVKGIILLIIGIVTITSCSPKEYEKIPLEHLDPKLKSKGDSMVNDIITSLTHKDGARFLMNKDYITPLAHARIIQNLEMYNESYKRASEIIGKVSGYQLFQVVDKQIVKTMRYQLETKNDKLDFIELKVDINRNLGLADFYLYVTSKDGCLKRENILPRAIK